MGLKAKYIFSFVIILIMATPAFSEDPPPKETTALCRVLDPITNEVLDFLGALHQVLLPHYISNSSNGLTKVSDFTAEVMAKLNSGQIELKTRDDDSEFFTFDHTNGRIHLNVSGKTKELLTQWWTSKSRKEKEQDFKSLVRQWLVGLTEYGDLMEGYNLWMKTELSILWRNQYDVALERSTTPAIHAKVYNLDGVSPSALQKEVALNLWPHIKAIHRLQEKIGPLNVAANVASLLNPMYFSQFPTNEIGRAEADQIIETLFPSLEEQEGEDTMLVSLADEDQFRIPFAMLGTRAANLYAAIALKEYYEQGLAATLKAEASTTQTSKQKRRLAGLRGGKKGLSATKNSVVVPTQQNQQGIELLKRFEAIVEAAQLQFDYLYEKISMALQPSGE